jgi:hypothetical protein
MTGNTMWALAESKRLWVTGSGLRAGKGSTKLFTSLLLGRCHNLLEMGGCLTRV